MSHSIEFMRFENEEAVPFNLEKLRAILQRYGCEIYESSFGGLEVQFPLDGEHAAIGNEEGSIGLENSEAISFGIGRPVYDDQMRKLAFDLLKELQLCAFPSFGEQIYSTINCEKHIPSGLLSTCENGLEIVTNVSQLW